MTVNMKYLNYIILSVLILQNFTCLTVLANIQSDDNNQFLKNKISSSSQYNVSKSNIPELSKFSPPINIQRISTIQTALYYTYQFNNSYPFLRSGSILTATVNPTTPLKMLVNWDNTANSTTIPSAPVLTGNSLNETHVLYIYSQRPDNSWEKFAKLFNIDDSAVIVTLQTPARTKVTGFDNVQLNYYPSNILGRTWAFNNFPFALTEPITFPKDSYGSPIQGQQILHIKAVDHANRVWSYDFIFWVDSIAPLIVPLNFLNNTVIPSGTQLNFENKTPTSIYDDHYFFNFSWNNGPIFHTFPVVPSPNAQYTLKVVLSDEVGNFNTQYFAIKAKMNFTKQPKLSYRPKEYPTVAYTETPVYLNYTLIFTFNNTLISSNSSILPQFPDGNTNVTFMVNAMDSGSNWLNSTFDIKLDNIKISFLSSSPGNTTVIDQSVPNANIILSFGEIPYVIIYNFNTTNTNFTTIPSIPSFTGVFKLRVFFSDLAGNWDNITLLFSRNVKVTANITNTQIIDPSSIITLNSTGYIQKYSYFFNNNTQTNVNAVTSLINITTPSVSNDYTLFVTVYSNNTMTTYSIGLTVRIGVKFTDSNVNPYQSSVKINFTFSEIPKSWYYVWDSINDVTKFNFDGNPVLPTGDGVHTLYIKSINSNANIEFVSSKSFTTDNTKPVIALDTSKNTNGSYIKAGKLLFFTGLSSDVKSISYTWDSNTLLSLSLSNISIYLPKIDGIHTLQIRLVDKANNMNNYIYVFKVDFTAPTIYSSIANNSQIIYNTSIVFNFSEALGPSASYVFNNNKYSISNNQITITNFGSGNKTINITISAIDSFANNNTQFYMFTVIDPALQWHFNIPGRTLLNKSTTVIVLTLSKTAKVFHMQWVQNGNVIVKDTFVKNSDTTYSITPPFAYVYITLNYEIQTNNNIWTNNTITFLKDTSSPSITLHLSQYNKTSNQYRFINATSSTTDSIDANTAQTIYFSDFSEYAGIITLTYSNGTKDSYNFTSNASFEYSSDSIVLQNNAFTFNSPGKGQSVTISVSVHDKVGNSASKNWKISVYDSPEFSPISLFSVVLCLFGLAVVQGIRRHE